MDKEQAARRKSLLVRWWGIVLVFLGVFWLPVEDVSLGAVTLLAAGLCGWLGVWCALRWPARLPPERYPLWGLAVGLAVPVAAIGLMVFKSGLHAHGYSDFTAQQMGQMLKGGFGWAGGGLAMGWVIKRMVVFREGGVQ